MPDNPPWQDVLAEYQRLLDTTPQVPREIAASDGATVDALLAGIPKSEPGALAGTFGSIPIVIDAGLPPGRVELRDRDGNATTRLRLVAGHWFDEDELAAAAEWARQISLTDNFRIRSSLRISAGPLFDGRLPPPGV